MEVALTGGTGFVGSALTRGLLAAGCRVRLLVRPLSKRRTPQRPDPPALQRLPVDLDEPRPLAAALKGADAVVHLIGIISEAGRQTFEYAHPGLTSAVLAAAAEARVPRWIHMSALGTRPAARSRYHQTKWAAEQLVRQSGLDWTIFRPSLIYGSGDGFTNLYARLAAASPVLPVFGGGHSLVQPISVDQVARAFVGSLGVVSGPAGASSGRLPSLASGQTYDLCGDERLPFAEVVRTLLRAMDRRRWLLPVPWGIARLQAAALEAVGTLIRRPPPLSRDQLLMLQEDNVGDGVPANRAFGLEHPSFLDGVRRYLGTP